MKDWSKVTYYCLNPADVGAFVKYNCSRKALSEMTEEIGKLKEQVNNISSKLVNTEKKVIKSSEIIDVDTIEASSFTGDKRKFVTIFLV